MATDNRSRPLSKQGKANHERIFGQPKKFRGVIRFGEASGEKRMDKDWSREMHNKENKRKLDKDEQKFEVPQSEDKGRRETIVLKKSWSDGQKRRAIADACNRAGYRPGDRDVTPDSVSLING